MAKALFVGLSAAFFTGYSLIASALLVPNQNPITPISPPSQEDCDDVVILLPGTACYQQEASTIPIIGGLLAGASNVLSIAGTLFGGFFQLITFQAQGLGAASMITALIFVPLGFINGFIIFTAIRGSS